MFYGQCWKCGERWELGTASTCTCPEETTIDWKDYSIPVDKMSALSIGNIKPNYNMTFHRDGKQIGVLDFNGPEMTFTGDADKSAKVFFDWIAKSFKARLEQERADERNSWPLEMEAMERQVNILTDALADSRNSNAELLNALKLIVDSPDEESDVTAYENAVKAIAKHGSNK